MPEAARRVGRDPETVRRWIRAGKLRARKIGTQHVIEEGDIEPLLEDPPPLPVPAEWERSDSGEPQPDWGAIVRRSRQGH